MPLDDSNQPDPPILDQAPPANPPTLNPEAVLAAALGMAQAHNPLETDPTGHMVDARSLIAGLVALRPFLGNLVVEAEAAINDAAAELADPSLVPQGGDPNVPQPNPTAA